MGCRHTKAWAVSGGYLLWCPDCGAIRAMTPNSIDGTWSPAWSRWIRPRGQEQSLSDYHQILDRAVVKKGNAT